MRTYSREQWEEAQYLWNDFSGEWKEVRHQAGMRGILYPPAGTKWDSWDDDEPSQRAILIRAIRETPALLSQAVAHSKSWHDTIAYIMRRHEEWREEINASERERIRRKAELDSEPRQAALSLKAILTRIGDS